MAQSLMTLIFTGLLLLAQTLGINTGTEPKTVNDLVAAFDDLRDAFLEKPGNGKAVQDEAAGEHGAPAQSGAGPAQDGAAAGEAAAPGMQSFTLGEGEEWETTYYVVDSGVDGPAVMVVAGLHGDEPAATLAAKDLVEQAQSIARGKVILIPEADAAAIQAKKRFVDADLDRAFPTEGVHGETPAPKEPAAQAIWRLVEEYRPDWLIDLHDESTDAPGQAVIYHEMHADAAAAARAVADHLNQALDEADTPFEAASGPAAGSLAKAASELLDVRSLVLKTHRQHSLASRTAWLSGGAMHLLSYLEMR